MNIYDYQYKKTNLGSILGLTFKKISVDKDLDQIIFEGTEGRTFIMLHDQSCCESVYIDDITGSIKDLVGSPILLAEESTNCNDNPEGVPAPKYQESFTWTFYKFATIKGYVDIRWYGESNGYYSEEVDFFEILKEKE